MITERSRYAKGIVAWVDHPTRGRVQVVHLQPLQWTNYPYSQHQVTTADTVESLAHGVYGSAQQYWFIAELNPTIECPDDLRAGDIINIPSGRPR